MSAAQLKYVRTIVGFLVFPPMVATHKQAASGAPWPVLSAGFVDWDADGRPLCMGESDSLGIKSREDDTDALRAEWGMTAPTAPTVGDWAIDNSTGKPILVHKNCSVIESEQAAYVLALIAADQASRPAITLTPAMRADAEAIGACCDPMSLESWEPVL